MLNYELKKKILNAFLNNYFEKWRSGRFRDLLATSWVFITLFFGYQLQFLQPDFEFEKFFPSDDPDIVFYEAHLEHFQYDNDYLIVIVEKRTGVFDTAFLHQLDRLSGALNALEHVEQVASPTDLRHLIKGPMGTTSIPLIHLEEPDRLSSDSARIMEHPIYRSFFSEDAHSAMILLNHTHLQDPVAANDLVAQIRDLSSSEAFDNVRIIGKLVAQKTFIDYIQQDFVKFLAAALVLSFVLLSLLFRSFHMALLPYAISVTSLVWLLGLMALMGKPITILGSLIPPVILFVSSSDAVHFINAYRSSTAPDFYDRLKLAAAKVLMPTFLTSVTTAIGFISLMAIDTEPVQDLGIFCGIGVLMAFFITFCYAPLVIRRQYPAQQQSAALKRSAIWVLRHPRLIFTVSTLVILLSVGGLFMLKTDAYLLNDLPADAQVRQDFEFADEHFGGSKPWELAYWPKNADNIWDEQVMREADKIHTYLRNQYPVSRLTSPVTFIKYGHQMNNGGLNTAYAFPPPDDYTSALRSVRTFTKSNELPTLFNDEENYARMTGFIQEYGSHETINRNQQLRKYLMDHMDHELIGYRITGTTYLIDKSHELLSANLIKGLLIALTIISILLGLYFKSFKILIISIIPNIIPLLITAGFMGWTGISLQLTTSIIFAVAFGIAVDDTIHFIAAYRQSKRSHPVLRLTSTFQSTGKALIVTTLVIVAGFMLFIFSSFGATYYLGLFLSIALVVALITDLTLLPLLLHQGANKPPK